MSNDTGKEVKQEISVIKARFSKAGAARIEALAPLIEQAAAETVIVRQLSQAVLEYGSIRFHPTNKTIQKETEASKALRSHTATLTKVMNCLIKSLGV